MANGTITFKLLPIDFSTYSPKLVCLSNKFRFTYSGSPAPTGDSIRRYLLLFSSLTVKLYFAFSTEDLPVLNLIDVGSSSTRSFSKLI